jgi:hypothetical protein
MRRLTILVFILSIVLLSACASSNNPAGQDPADTTTSSLVVSGGEISKTYTRADLEALPASQAIFNEITYQGVTISTLIQDAGFDPALVKAIKVVASDGFTVNYDTSQVLVDEVILAYARPDGELAEDDGAFRMVLPGAEGKLNARMLVELQVIQ